MKLSFKRRRIETFCTYFYYILMLGAGLLFVLYRADEVFQWNIMPYRIQRYIESMIIPSFIFLIVALFLISFLVNMSLISANMERIADALEEKKKDNGQN